MPPYRLAYLVSHPIQYQAPFLRLLAKDPEIELKVFFASDFSAKLFLDPEMNTAVEWDIPLLEGYPYEVLPALGPRDIVNSVLPLNYGLCSRLHRRHFDAVWIHGYARFLNFRALLIAKMNGLKILMRDEATLQARPPAGFKGTLKSAYFLALRNLCDAFLPIGSKNCEYFRSMGVSEEKLFLMPYAVDNEFFAAKAREASSRREDLRQELGLAPGRPIILYAAKLVERKCPQDLLEAFRLLAPDGRREPSAYLLYVGDGELRPELEARAKATGWSSIKFLGFKNQTELPRFFDLCDLFVLPSRFETWGLVVNEVMNAGRPIVLSTDVGCQADLLRHGENGYRFETGNVAALQSALAQALASPQRLKQMGEKSKALIEHWSFREDLAGLKQALGKLC